MKKTLFTMMLLIAGGSTLITSCKKKSTDDKNPPYVPSTICDGNGSASYFPLVLNNTWTYYIPGFPNSPVLTVTQTTNQGSKTYFVVEDNTGYIATGSEWWLREDAGTHNIYYYDINNHVEYLYIPGNPTLNQEWSMGGTIKRKVTDLNASYSSSGCSYTGLLEISESMSSTVTDKRYYKKGLGLVYSNSVELGGMDYNISAITLH